MKKVAVLKKSDIRKELSAIPGGPLQLNVPIGGKDRTRFGDLSRLGQAGRLGSMALGGLTTMNALADAGRSGSLGGMLGAPLQGYTAMQANPLDPDNAGYADKTMGDVRTKCC